MFIFRSIKKLLNALDKAFAWTGKALWRIVEIAIVVGIVLGVVSLFKGASTLPPNSVLVLDLSQTIVENPQTQPMMLTMLSGAKEEDTSLHNVLVALKEAKADPMVKGLFLKLDKLEHAGLASTQEIGAAIDHFKESGKPVWAWGSNFTQAQYAIASHANEIFMHPMGEVGVKGLSSNRLYYGDLLKTLGVNVHVFKAGAYKSFPESFTQNAPSQAWREAERSWLINAWTSLVADMESARGLMPKAIDKYIAELPERLRANQGNLAKTALDSGLVDGLRTLDEMNEYIEQKLSKGKKTAVTWVPYLDYTTGVNLSSLPNSIAVIVAEGEIREGESDFGIIGADTVIDVIDAAREDDSIKAIVFRVNSPGGSANASEYIRHALERAKKAGKPVVVSMGDTAASGGYWISMGGSKVIASPVTITGSIGVFGLMPTFEKTLKLAQIGQGSVATTWLAGANKAIEPLDPRLEDILTQSVARTYKDFTGLVAKSRGLPLTDVQNVAQGRVWTGAQAKNFRLVDQVGGFEEAVTLARTLAKLPADAPVVFYCGNLNTLSSMVKSNLRRWTSPLSWIQLPESVRKELINAQTALDWTSENPRTVFAHSLLKTNF